MHCKRGRVCKLLSAEFASIATGGGTFAHRATTVRQDVLGQSGAGGEAPPAGCEWAAQGRLAGVGESVQVQAVLRDAAVAAHVTLELSAHPSTALASVAPALWRLPRAALQVQVQHGLVQERRTTLRTQFRFLI